MRSIMNNKELFKYRVDAGKWCLTTFGIVAATDEKEAEKILMEFYDDAKIVELRRAVLNDSGGCEVYTDSNYVEYAD